MTLIPTAPDTRDDLIFSLTAAARYNFRNSLAAVLQYRFVDASRPTTATSRT